MHALRCVNAGVLSIGTMLQPRRSTGATMYRKILVPIDGSDTAQTGLLEAMKLAKALDATLVLLHVIESTPVVMEVASADVWAQLIENLRQQGQRTLDRAHDMVRAAPIACEAYLEDAAVQPVCDVIVAQTRLHHCDLIVMGTHGRRGIARVLVGSDAETVVRKSPVPVMLVRSAAAAI
jgi:nucleotide-binding universal stress UspA family protein